MNEPQPFSIKLKSVIEEDLIDNEEPWSQKQARNSSFKYQYEGIDFGRKESQPVEQ